MVVIALYDLIVYDLDQNGAKARIFIVVAAGEDLVELVERDGIHDTLHKVFRRFVLLVLELVRTVLFSNLS